MILVVGLVSGMTALVCALLVPAWALSILLVASRSTRIPDAAQPLCTAPMRSTAGLRGPPHLLTS
jgi:hypothetical protein